MSEIQQDSASPAELWRRAIRSSASMPPQSLLVLSRSLRAKRRAAVRLPVSRNRHQPRTEGIAMTVSFQTDILPLFTSMDIEHMARAEVSLDDYSYMSQPDNANRVYEQVSSGHMPPGDSGEQPWSQDRVELFKTWMDGGFQP
jgi:hypothetical protein